jgi:hypothetical protein
MALVGCTTMMTMMMRADGAPFRGTVRAGSRGGGSPRRTFHEKQPVPRFVHDEDSESWSSWSSSTLPETLIHNLRPLRQRRRVMEDDEETDEPSDLPSHLPTVSPSGSPTVSPSPTASPTAKLSLGVVTSEPSRVATNIQSPTAEAMDAPASSSSLSNIPTVSEDDSKNTDDDMVVETNQRALLPFSIVVFGRLDDEGSVRGQLQDYLTTYLQGPPQSMEAVQSTQLKQVAVAIEEGDDGSDNDGGDRYGGSSRRRIRRKERHRKFVRGRSGTSETRSLQDINDGATPAATAATVSSTTSLRYQGLVYLKDDETEGGTFYDTKPTLEQVQEAQTAALEDTQALQDFFMDVFVSLRAEAGDGGDEEALPDPVVLLHVRVDDRPELALDPAETFQLIEESPTAGEGSDNAIDDDEGDEPANGSTNTNLSSNSDSISNNANGPGSPWIIGLMAGVALVAVAIIGSLLLVWRRKRRKNKDALEIISEADSNEYMDVIVYDKSTLQVSATNSSESAAGGTAKIQGNDAMNKRNSSSGITTRISGHGFSLLGTKNSAQTSPPSRDEEEEIAQATESDLTLAAFNNCGASRSLDSRLGIEDVAGGSIDGKEMVGNSFSLGNTKPVVTDLTTEAKHSSGAGSAEEVAPAAPGIPPIGFARWQPSFAAHNSRSTNQSNLSQKTLDDLDSLVAKMNVFSANSYDEESMMGYSLSSGHGPEINFDDTSIKTNNEDTAAGAVNVGIVAGLKHNAGEHNIVGGMIAHEEAIENTRHPVDAPTDGDDKDLTKENASVGGNDVVSDSSSQESDSRQNPLFAGVQNLLNSSMDMDQSAKNRSPAVSRKRWYDQLRIGKKKRPEAFLSSDSESNRSVGMDQIAPRHEVSPEKSKTSVTSNNDDDHASTEGDDHSRVESGIAEPVVIPESEDEAASSYKEEDSFKGSGSSVMSGSSSTRFSDADPIYTVNGTMAPGPVNLSSHACYMRKIRDDDGDAALSDLRLFAEITPAPSEELDALYSYPDPPLAVGPDDVSDAPSDERHHKVPLSVFHQSILCSTNGHVITLDKPTVDDDPAVVEYLMKERRNMKQRTRRKRADRKQPPVTMEV